MKIVIAGGSGFIGQELINYFGKDHTIVLLTRGFTNAANNRYNESTSSHAVQSIKWDGVSMGDWCRELEGAELLINLCGRSVNCRYTEKNKAEIMNSRIRPVAVLAEAIRLCKHPPALWINASSATIYRHAVDRPQDEYTGTIENDFSVQVCKAWEKIFFEQNLSATRQVALRMAITLGNGGVMVPYFRLLKFGLSGPQGNGRQMYSWVHATDLCRVIDWIVAHPDMEGVYNVSAPNPVSNKVFMAELRRVTGHRWGLPAPAWLLKMGAWIIGTETELLLKSRWVLPTRLEQSGFRFQYTRLEEAVKAIVAGTEAHHYRFF